MALTCSTLIGLTISAGCLVVGHHFYKNRTHYANRFLEGLNKNYEISLEDLDVSKVGIVEIKNISVKSRAEGGELVRVDQMRLTYHWPVLRREGKFQNLHMRGGNIRLVESSFRDAGKFAVEDETAPSPLSHLLFRVKGRIEIEDVDWMIDHPQTPPFRARGEIRAKSMDFAADGLTQDKIDFRFSEILVGDEGVFGSMDRFEAQARISDDLTRIQAESISLFRPVLTIVPEWFTPGERADTPSNRVASPIREGTVEKFEATAVRFFIEEADLKILGFDGNRPDSVVIPDLAFRTDKVDWSDLSLRKGRLDSAGPLELNLKQLVVTGGRAELVHADRARFKTRTLGAVVHDGHLLSASGDKVKVTISDDSLSLWRERKGKREATAARGVFRVDEIAFPEAHFLLAEFEDQKGVQWPRITSDLQTVLKDVTFDHQGMHSSVPLHGEFQNFVLHGPGVDPNEESLVTFPKAQIDLVWDNFSSKSHLERVAIDSPIVTFTDKTLGEWAGNLKETKEEGGDRSARKIFKVQNLEVNDGTLVADSPSAFSGVIPRIQGSFSLANDQIGQDLGELGYRLKISRFQLSNHPQRAVSIQPDDGLFPASFLPDLEALKSEEIVKLDEAYVDFTATGLQRDGKIKKVKVAGGSLKVGEGLKDVIKKPRQEPEPMMTADSPAFQSMAKQPGSPKFLLVEPRMGVNDLPGLLQAFRSPVEVQLGGESGPFLIPRESGPDLPPLVPVGLAPNFVLTTEVSSSSPVRLGGSRWQIEDLEISGAKVDFESVIPEMNGLSFGLETRMREIPLTPEGLLDANKIQSVQIDGIEIRDPFDSFLIVAKLPDLFVEFSLAGLARQEIEKIDIVSPTLNVGESLFRWVDYLRKYRAINEGARIDVRGGLMGKSEKTSSDWVINSINANAGKLVIAPYGTPVTSLPFPFSATTNVGEGKIKLNLNIPEDLSAVYRVPDYGVELSGLKGTLGLNLPIPEKDNNLVQTFTLQGGKWRKFRAKDLFLSVTFDRFGIYGIFGGEAYGGYANGAFNYYLSENGRWDAWLAGTNLDTDAVTRELIPGGFAMGGKINTKIFSGGVNSKVDDITGEISAAGEGWFDIEVLEKALERMPENWKSLQKGLAQIAVDSLKRFDYKEGSGELKLKGDDGHLKLQFKGDFGSRNLNLFLHGFGTPIGEAAEQ